MEDKNSYTPKEVVNMFDAYILYKAAEKGSDPKVIEIAREQYIKFIPDGVISKRIHLLESILKLK